MPRIIWVALILLSVSTTSWARPVSYPGGWTVMQRNNSNFSSLHLHYSPTARYSLGYRGEYWLRRDAWLQSLAVNNLIKRWNRPASQANFYLKSGLGAASSSSTSDPLAYTGVGLDWEDRRYFTSYEIRGQYADQVDRSVLQEARIGVAPYVGEYGDLHTWIMLQADYEPEGREPFTLTPLLRFFKSEYLLEVGINQRTDVLINWIVRF